MLRSVNVLFFPVIGLLVAGLAALWLHRRVEGWLATTARPRRRDLTLMLSTWAWGWLPILLGIGLAAWSSTVLVAMVPFPLTAGLMTSLYARFLKARVEGRPAYGRLWVALVSSLLVVLLFWDVQRIASAFGTEYAKYVKAKPSEFAEVSLLSERPLNLAPYKVTLSDAGPAVSHRYRYDGFWLMNYANNRYVLLASTDKDETVVVVVPDTAEVQLAFDPSPAGG